jgi:hypothetical protein
MAPFLFISGSNLTRCLAARFPGSLAAAAVVTRPIESIIDRSELTGLKA